MLAKNARGWSFDAPLSDACEIQCQDDDCAVWSPLAAWSVEDLECETCGEHDAMECPACGWLHDHVHSGLTPFRVRGQTAPELSTRDKVVKLWQRLDQIGRVPPARE